MSEPPPSTSRATLTVEEPGSLSIALPALGFRAGVRESKFALAFTAIVAGLTLFFAFLLSGAPQSVMYPFIGVISLFWIGVLYLLAEMVRMMFTRAIIDVVGDTLLITIQKPGKVSSVEIPTDKIKALGVGPSGVVVDNQPILALRIDTRSPIEIGQRGGKPIRKKKHIFFRERAEDELEWIAETLREALGIETAKAKSWAKDAASSSSHDAFD
ncbi:MAG: hypothetical protein AAGB34_08385 [Planctomycetota bacterium]